MKKLILALVIGVVLTATILIKLAQSPSNNQAANTSRSAQISSTLPSDATGSSKGSYVDYSPDVVATAQGTKILFFHAPWCPQCRALEADIKAKGLPAGLTIIKVDYDSNQSLRQKYGVTIQTTLIKIDDQGDLIKKYVAYDEPNLEAVIKNLL